ncbi:MAG: hypothetical protein QUS14_16885 [Pyrinomonadaceae bacterium]|nr:hypothetical protein [Pyrinomonadaceae bacterium]
MKKFCCASVVLAVAASFTFAQADPDRQATRSSRVVVTESMPAAKPQAKPTPTPIIVGQTPQVTGPAVQPAESTPAVVPTAPRRPASAIRSLSFRDVKSKLAEAKRGMQARPISTALSGATFEGIETVRVAFHDWTTNEIDFVVITKEAFLSTKEEKIVRSENGKTLFTRTIRGNGVNTPITLVDEDGVSHLPLMVQYPRVEKGQYLETAYYMSTHPGLVTPEIVSAGRIYVRNVIEIARQKLAGHGYNIDPKIADIAERLAAVEHVDHMRFKNESHPDIYNDIYTLFALNEGQTYRYAVSSAGAGGMVQMIPSTYRMVRSKFSNVPLMADFVEGMRDHVNASQAMLLYMQWTWEDLSSRPAINEALLTGIATKEQLMAAGYNSNPARLAGYITRGGAGWTNLIPRETQMYLQIYASVERHVPMAKRTR